MLHHPCAWISEAGLGTLNSKTHGSQLLNMEGQKKGQRPSEGFIASSAAAAGVLRTLSSVLLRETCRSLKCFAP